MTRGTEATKLCWRLDRNWLGWIGALVITVCGVSSAECQMIVAHRGASADAPENTLASFRLAWEQGADAIEGDFYLTRDGQIATLHDATTKRTAGGVDLEVAKSTLAELQALDVGGWKSPQYRGERIPTLADVFATVPPGKKIFVEIKCGPEILPGLQDALEHSRLEPAQVVVISFSQAVIKAVKTQLPQIKAHWLVSYKQDEATGVWSPSPDEVLETLARLQADGIDTHGNRHVVDREFVSRLRGQGLEFHVWTIDDPGDARYFQQLGADSITTNRPAEIRAALTGQ